jgi:hypothetical protein
LLKTLEPEIEPVQREDTLGLALGLLVSDKSTPTDEEVEKWLKEYTGDLEGFRHSPIKAITAGELLRQLPADANGHAVT